MKKRNNEVPCSKFKFLNISLKEHIKSFQSEIYFLREQIRQKITSFHQYFIKKNMMIRYQINNQFLNMKQIELN